MVLRNFEPVNVHTTQNWLAKLRFGVTGGIESENKREGPAEELGVPNSTLHNYLKTIKKLDQRIPHKLTDANKELRMQISYTLVIRQRNGDFSGRVITCNKKWILYDNRRSSAYLLNDEAQSICRNQRCTLARPWLQFDRQLERWYVTVFFYQGEE
ncbi:putative SET domain and mariner transposase fusion protein [Trypoxylus dichotomus]